jgi:hypothetical protein
VKKNKGFRDEADDFSPHQILIKANPNLKIKMEMA